MIYGRGTGGRVSEERAIGSETVDARGVAEDAQTGHCRIPPCYPSPIAPDPRQAHRIPDRNGLCRRLFSGSEHLTRCMGSGGGRTMLHRPHGAIRAMRRDDRFVLRSRHTGVQGRPAANFLVCVGRHWPRRILIAHTEQDSAAQPARPPIRRRGSQRSSEGRQRSRLDCNLGRDSRTRWPTPTIEKRFDVRPHQIDDFAPHQFRGNLAFGI
jgi:hypothetical protein